MKSTKKLIIGLAELYGEALTPSRLELYYELLKGYFPDDVEKAINAIARDPAVTRFPLPAVIIERLQTGFMRPEVAAQEALVRILRAVSLFGRYDPAGARKYLGDPIWGALPGERGWEEFCNSGDPKFDLSITTARAQLRDRLVARFKIDAKQTGLVSLPAVSTGNKEPVVLLDDPHKEPDRSDELQKTSFTTTIHNKNN